MENQLKDLNKSLNRMMSSEERFTDKQKQNIRNAIAKKRSLRFSFMHWHWKPILSTAVCLFLVVAVVQVAMDTFPSSSKHSSESSDVGINSAADKSASLESGGTSEKTIPALDEADKGDAKLNAAKDDFSIAEKDDGQQKTISGPLLPIDDHLITVYEQVKGEQSQGALKGLHPFEVMQIHYHAIQQNDYETVYIMYYQDPAGSMPSKKYYLDEIAKDPVLSKNTEKKLEEIQEVEKFNQVVKETPMDRKEAYITWGGTGENMKFFRLVRDETKDIWAVSWLASQ
ncbi:hypothetical protein [Alkalihalobacillus sp. TS-13]|uniref:hypothetical protein n=1 Tax=Alkalihalobacillus sp. TS-13 TaxID=2842455 RepID=UPI001C874FCC|nr:hypothetical protein [Alkalihalobacillus sp. TS-13]